MRSLFPLSDKYNTVSLDAHLRIHLSRKCVSVPYNMIEDRELPSAISVGGDKRI